MTKKRRARGKTGTKISAARATKCRLHQTDWCGLLTLRWQELVVFLFLVWLDIKIIVFWVTQALQQSIAVAQTTMAYAAWWQRLLVYLVLLLPPFIIFIQMFEQSIFWGKIIAAVIGASSLMYFSYIILLAAQIGFGVCFGALAGASFFFFVAVSMFYKFQCLCAKPRPQR